MTKKAKVTVDHDHVKLRVKGATEKALDKIALEVEGHAKINITVNDQVDTGFMLNSVYVESQRGSTFGKTWEGDEKTKAPRLKLPRRYGSAAIVVGAVYAIYQEVLNSFLRTAGASVMSRVKGIVEPIYRTEIRD